MTEVQTAMPLHDLMVQQSSDCATGLFDGQEIVTLGPAVRGEIEVFLDGRVQVVRQDTRALPIIDGGRQLMLMRAALQLVHQHKKTSDAEFAAVLDRIRDYAIGKHQEGMFCREGLNEFLRCFGLAEYHPGGYDDER